MAAWGRDPLCSTSVFCLGWHTSVERRSVRFQVIVDLPYSLHWSSLSVNQFFILITGCPIFLLKIVRFCFLLLLLMFRNWSFEGYLLHLGRVMDLYICNCNLLPYQMKMGAIKFDVVSFRVYHFLSSQNWRGEGCLEGVNCGERSSELRCPAATLFPCNCSLQRTKLREVVEMHKHWFMRAPCSIPWFMEIQMGLGGKLRLLQCPITMWSFGH